MSSAALNNAWKMLKLSANAEVSGEKNENKSGVVDINSILHHKIDFTKSSEILNVSALLSIPEKCFLLNADSPQQNALMSENDIVNGVPSTSSSDSSMDSITSSSDCSYAPLPRSLGLQMIKMAYSENENNSPVQSPSLNSSGKKKISMKLHPTPKDVISRRESSSVSGKTAASDGLHIETAPLASTPKTTVNEVLPFSNFVTVDESTLPGVRCIPPHQNGTSKMEEPNIYVSSAAKMSRFSSEPGTSGLNGFSKYENVSVSSDSSSSDFQFSCLSTKSEIVQNHHMNGVVRFPRKRLLSDRGQSEAKFPITDRTFITSWQGCHLLLQCPDGRNVGVGLINYSNDCFLNAVLQTIVHTAPLARFVAEQHSPSTCASGPPACFVCAMGSHVRKAITNRVPFKANWIQPFLRKFFPSHIPGFQEDAHELLTLLLDALDLHYLPKANSATPNGINHLSESRVSTPIEQIFGGTLRNQIRCLSCSNIFINYERIRELNLGLKMKKREGSVSLHELLNDYFENETFSNFDCKRCKRKTHAIRSTRILRSPAVLLVQLKRFNAFGSKIRIPVNVEVNLPLDHYMYHSELHDNVYCLNSLIEHQGAGIDHGHYIAFVRGFDGKKWHMFDDESCQKLSFDNVQKRQAYLIVYLRKESCSDRLNMTVSNIQQNKTSSYDKAVMIGRLSTSLIINHENGERRNQ